MTQIYAVQDRKFTIKKRIPAITKILFWVGVTAFFFLALYGMLIATERFGIGAEYLVIVILILPVSAVLFYNLSQRRKLEVAADRIIIWNGKKEEMVILRDDVGTIKVSFNVIAPFRYYLPLPLAHGQSEIMLFVPIDFIKKDGAFLKYRINLFDVGLLIDLLISKGYERPKTYKFGKEISNVDWQKQSTGRLKK